jgi:DNA modification methylase
MTCPVNGCGDRSQTTLWEVSTALDAKDTSATHSTQKPVELFRRAILNHTNPGDFVFEPFSGSGSCIIAGEQSGRSVLAIEIDPGCVAQTVDRWEAFTGKKAKLR